MQEMQTEQRKLVAAQAYPPLLQIIVEQLALGLEGRWAVEALRLFQPISMITSS